MTGWRIVLEGEMFDLQYLEDHFRVGPIRVIKNGESYHLLVDQFAELTDDSVVFHQAEAVLTLINGAATAVDGAHRSVRVGSLSFTGPDGNTHNFKYLNARIEARSRLMTHQTSTHEEAQPAAPEISEMTRYVTYAEKDERAQRILRYLLNSRDWGSLYKVLEEIEEDLGGLNAIMDVRWASLRTLSRFTATANNRLAIGDAARHAGSKFKPPERPMTIESAGILVRGIALNWLRRKLSEAASDT